MWTKKEAATSEGKENVKHYVIVLQSKEGDGLK